MEIKDKIVEELKKIYDPEIPVNIYELGLIYKIDIKEAKKVNIEMTLTSPNCPVAESLPKMVKDNILKEDDKTKLMCLSGVKQYPMRVKCATLSWHTLVSAFEDKTDLVKTEN